MPDLLSASSQSLLAGLPGNFSLDYRVRSLARKPWSPAERRAPAAIPAIPRGPGRALRAPGALLPSLPSPGSRDGLCGLPRLWQHCHPSSTSAAARGAACTRAAAPVPGVSQDRGPAGTLGWTRSRSPRAAARSLSPGEAGSAPGGAEDAARSQGLGQVGRWADVTALLWGNRGSRSRMPQSTRLPCFCHFPALQTRRSQPRAWTPVGVPFPARLLCQCLQRVRSRQPHMPCPPAHPLPHLKASLPP